MHENTVINWKLMRGLWKWRQPLVTLLCVPVVATCGTTDPEVVASIEVTPASLVFTSLGDTEQFSATARDKDDNELSGKGFVWSSSAMAVVTINANTSLATSVSNGTATITATADGVSGNATITVNQTVASVSIIGDADTLVAIGATVQLSATARDGGESPATGATTTWESSDGSVATVAASGLVTAVANGTVTIRAIIDNVVGTFDITVAQVASALVITQQPAGEGPSGMPLNPQPVVRLHDANGYDMAEPGVAVTASIESGGGTLSGALTVNTDANGTATFADLTITGKSGDRTLRFGSGSISGVVSHTIAIGPGAADPTQSTADVPSAGTAGIATEIAVTVRDAHRNVTVGGDTVVVKVTGVSPATPIVTDNGDGTYLASYTPTVTGTDSVAISLNDVGINGSPFTITVSAGTVDPGQSTATVSTAGTAGIVTAITVQARDSAGNALPRGGASVVVKVTGANTISPPAMDNNDGTYSASYIPATAGADNIAITLNGTAINGSPFSSAVSPGASDPTQTTASVPAGGQAGTTTNMTVTVRDANGNQLTGGGGNVVVTVTGANSAVPSVTDNGNGTYSASYTPTVGGTDSVSIALNGAPINGSPFTSIVLSARVDSILVEPKSAWLLFRDTVRLEVTAFDSAGNVVPDADYEYAATPAGLVTMSADGLVTVVDSGTVTITITTGEVSGVVQFELFPGSGVRVPSLSRIDSVVLSEMMRLGIPGGAVSIVRDERLVFARGYGYADSAAQRPVGVDTALFRIGSLSKPVTAAAVMKLVENKLLNLEDGPFAIRSDLTVLPPGQPEDPRLTNITVRNLLQHRGGWGSRAVDDTVWFSVLDSLRAGRPFDPDVGFRYGRGEPLTFEPGQQVRYTNYAFQALARVIEGISGTDYVEYVQSTILIPAGIDTSRMRFGTTPVGDRHPAEVSYYTGEPPINGPFGFGSRPDVGGGMEYYDASGSWIASAIDLARFITAVDGAPNRTDVLQAAAVDTMFAERFGWFDVGNAIGHTGAADGGDALIEIRPDGITFIVLFNKTRDLLDSADGAIRAAIDAVVSWPDHDFFVIH